MKLLITGGCGFLGSNLTAEAIARGHETLVFDDFSRIGSEQNRRWLERAGAFRWQHGDIRNQGDVSQAISSFRPEFVFHLAGQVAMTTSVASPRKDFEINALGTINVLEAIRDYAPSCGVIYSSSNKVYGDLEKIRYDETALRYLCPDYPDGFDEETPFDGQSPYGCSKAAADLYVRDYSRTFGLNTVVFRHSSMYGGRQFATFDQGWIGWFCAEALRVKVGDKRGVVISGNGKQVRDVLHAQDMVSLYFAAADRIDEIRGQAFNIGGGMSNSLSLRELLEMLGETLGVQIAYESIPARPGDQKVFVADIRKVRQALQWSPGVSVAEGMADMLEWCRTATSHRV